jgi:hypothetical protein
MAPLPYWQRATIDLRKLRDYCLDPAHPHGRHRARVFREALGIGQENAEWLRGAILEELPSQEAVLVCDKNYLDFQVRRNCPSAGHLLGTLMDDRKQQAAVLDVVALLADLPRAGLARGQVGTVVEELGDADVLVEFSDGQEKAYAILPCSRSELLVLHYAPQAA